MRFSRGQKLAPGSNTRSLLNYSRRSMRPSVLSRGLFIGSALFATLPLWAQTNSQLQGDLGLAVFRTPAITSTTDRSNVVLPYVYADYGAWYGRIDTFGYKVVPVGKGYLELAARVSLEGYRPSNPAIDKRSNPVPIGLGSFQKTPYGAFFLYGFGDPVSGGTLVDVFYAAEWGLGPLHVYPQVGFERRSARYVQHLYGVSAAESGRSGAPIYSPSSSVTPKAAIAIDYELMKSLKFTGEIERKWLDKSIYDSPLVNARTQTKGFLALTRTFQ